jgi:hypothetical protein
MSNPASQARLSKAWPPICFAGIDSCPCKAPDGIGRPGARARPRDRSAKLGSGCQLPAPAPRTGRLHRTGSAGQPPAPDPGTGLRSSDRGASFPRQRLGRGGCTGRDRPASPPAPAPRTGLRSSDRGASFPRQRLGRGGCTGRDRPASRPRQLPGQVCEARIGVPASRASASDGAVAPDGIGRPAARARPRDRSAKLGSGCQLPAPAPRTGRLHRTGSAGQPPAPDPGTGLRSSDRGASFPRQRLGRGGCTGRDLKCRFSEGTLIPTASAMRAFGQPRAQAISSMSRPSFVTCKAGRPRRPLFGLTGWPNRSVSR